IGALSGLHHADSAKASRVRVRREVAQDRVGVLMLVIDKGGEVALGVEHFALPRGPIMYSLCSYVYHGLERVAIAMADQIGWTTVSASMYSVEYNAFRSQPDG